MSENEPREPRFILRFENGVELFCTPETSHAFVHSEEPQGDHLFIYKSIDPDDEPIGNYVFRDQLQDFDDTIKFMEMNGYAVIRTEKLTPHDTEAYGRYLATLLLPKMMNVPEVAPVEVWVSPRHERLAQFVAYLLMTEQLSAEDFNGTGDLFI